MPLARKSKAGAGVQRGWMRENDETGLRQRGQMDWGFATGGERPAGKIYLAVALFLLGNNWLSHTVQVVRWIWTCRATHGTV